MFNVFAVGLQNVTNGVPSTLSNGYGPSASVFRGYTIGFGLTGAQVTSYTNIFNSFRAAMGRLDALTPQFGATTSSATGFTVQITNYDSSYSWSGSAIAQYVASGSVAISGSGLVTVSGQASAKAVTATIQNFKSGYPRGSAYLIATTL